ncbi:MAG: hypothetical protein AVDCRST_MAG25-3570, partial [uncultured Rubrobacteraceae bacterium]
DRGDGGGRQGLRGAGRSEGRFGRKVRGGAM